MIIPLEKLLEKTLDPFHLVIVAARRTRQLNAGAPKLTGLKTSKSSTIALYEIMEGKISFTQLEPLDEAPGS